MRGAKRNRVDRHSRVILPLLFQAAAGEVTYNTVTAGSAMGGGGDGDGGAASMPMYSTPSVKAKKTTPAPVDEGMLTYAAVDHFAVQAPAAPVAQVLYACLVLTALVAQVRVRDPGTLGGATLAPWVARPRQRKRTVHNKPCPDSTNQRTTRPPPPARPLARLLPTGHAELRDARSSCGPTVIPDHGLRVCLCSVDNHIALLCCRLVRRGVVCAGRAAGGVHDDGTRARGRGCRERHLALACKARADTSLKPWTD